MTQPRPHKTAADLMVIALSPALIMALVGSLCFFLIQVFYRGQMAGSARWVMFWFVIAIVLVPRIAIEESSEYAALYGLGLAGAVWIYLVRMQPAYVPCILLLALIWFCAHKLVWDCTLIDEDEDSSGQGLLQSRPRPKAELKPQAKSKGKVKRKRAASGSPGMWVVYFSLAALPVFGVGQSLLPAADEGSRRVGMMLVVLYMSAALGLLVTTSFLGLRRYLRQRYLRMPAAVALSWLKWGVLVALVILAAAFFLPRPGANQAWTGLRYQIDTRLRQASQFAAKDNPPGQGKGRAGNQSGGNQGEGKQSGNDQSSGSQGENKTVGQQPSGQSARGPSPSSAPSAQPAAGAVLTGQAGSIYQFLRTSFQIVAALVAVWWLFRCRFLLLEIGRSLIAGIVAFFQQALLLLPRRPARPRQPEAPRPKQRRLADYKNPFFAAREHSLPPAEIVLYTYEFVRDWAREQGIELHPEQTAREFCREMAERSPELAGSYRRLSFLYAYAAYSQSMPARCDLDPLKEIWRQLSWPADAPRPAG